MEHGKVIGEPKKESEKITMEHMNTYPLNLNLLNSFTTKLGQDLKVKAWTESIPGEIMHQEMYDGLHTKNSATTEGKGSAFPKEVKW